MIMTKTLPKQAKQRSGFEDETVTLLLGVLLLATRVEFPGAPMLLSIESLTHNTRNNCFLYCVLSECMLRLDIHCWQPANLLSGHQLESWRASYTAYSYYSRTRKSQLATSTFAMCLCIVPWRHCQRGPWDKNKNMAALKRRTSI